MSGEFSDSESQPASSAGDAAQAIVLPEAILHEDLLTFFQLLEDMASQLPTPPVFTGSVDIPGAFAHIHAEAPFWLELVGASITEAEAIHHLTNLATYYGCATWDDFFRDVGSHLDPG